MAKELKVYGWYGRRHNENTKDWPHGQTREIMAAYSVAEVLRKTGMSRSDWNHSGAITGNEAEVKLAMNYPGAVFYNKMNNHRGDPWYNEHDFQVTDEPYPENEKRAKLMPQIDALYEFLENLSSMNLALCDPEYEGNRYYPTGRSFEQIINQHFGIDGRKLEQERRAMLEQYR